MDTAPTLPSVTGACTTPISILLINPNSTPSMTAACLRSIGETLPPMVTVHGFTAPPSAPSAIEGRADAVLSAADCFRSVVLMTKSQKFDAFLVACFSAHPLIPMLREEFTQPAIGIMEAALYASRMCGDRLGIVTTGQRSRFLHEDAIALSYGLGSFSAGCETSDLGVLELESKPKEEVYVALVAAARRLVERGADCICLGCAGMTEMQQVCSEAVKMNEREVMVVDGVAMGVQFLIGLLSIASSCSPPTFFISPHTSQFLISPKSRYFGLPRRVSRPIRLC
ncbi:Carbon-nitrogen hydrolase [Pleurostoma richardsiae]|uniref:Carbon-nitrogen hydrolase n=1 Tax=Pleurostoma richardsiae TaxID=41990 RepID=A0AA38RH78_9PEZI|nr:Carbon-nitrogen hydrolase [Pleurostoma richardsiae]